MEVPKCVAVPKLAYRYWPKGEEAVQAPGKFGTRVVFHRQEFTDSEEALIDQLQALLDTSGRMGAAESVQRPELLRYIYAAKWDVREAASMLQSHLSWVQNDLPSFYPQESVSPVLASGALYLHGRDHKFRPLLVLTASRLRQFPLSSLVSAGVFYLEYILDHMLLPGQVETVGVIADCEDYEGAEYTVEELKQAFGLFMLHYPCRLAWGCVVRGKYSVWSRLTAFMDPDTSGKFLLNPGVEALLSLCHPSQLESKFGGTAATLSSYWPPDFPEFPRPLTKESVQSYFSEYSSYQEYHPERSLTETSGLGTDRGTPVREMYDGVPGDQELMTFESDYSDAPEAQATEDRELSDAMETLRVKVQLTKVRYRAYSERPNTTIERGGKVAWCSCMSEGQEQQCRLW